MMHPLLVAALVAAATWDGWRWYGARIWASPEEAAALVLTLLFFGALFVARGAPAAPQRMTMVLIAAGLLALYAVSFLLLPPILRAAIAITATLFCLHVALFGERPPVAFWGLVALALPVLPSLQFTLGYPMRILSAVATVGLLQLNGMAVARQGTFLLWRDEMIQFDAPCSGVSMLWAALLLTLMGCVLFRLGVGKVAIAVPLAIAAVLACNVLRTSSLFYLETGFLPQAAAWWHEAIGLGAFVLAAAMILRMLMRLRDWETFAWAR